MDDLRNEKRGKRKSSGAFSLGRCQIVLKAKRGISSICSLARETNTPLFRLWTLFGSWGSGTKPCGCPIPNLLARPLSGRNFVSASLVRGLAKSVSWCCTTITWCRATTQMRYCTSTVAIRRRRAVGVCLAGTGHGEGPCL